MMTRKWQLLICLAALVVFLDFIMINISASPKIGLSQCVDNPSVTHISLPCADRYLKTSPATLKEWGNLNVILGGEDTVLLTTYRGEGASGTLQPFICCG